MPSSFFFFPFFFFVALCYLLYLSSSPWTPLPSISSSVISARQPQAREEKRDDRASPRKKKKKKNHTHHHQQLARFTVAFRNMEPGPSPVEREALRRASRGVSGRRRRVSVIMLVPRKAVPVSVWWTGALRMLRSYGQVLVSPQSRIRRVAAPCSGLTQNRASHHGTNAQCQWRMTAIHVCARWCCQYGRPLALH
ncbi:hypothetical protein V8C35DRAFT_300554 [Trichoderma chlorosporum]